MNAPEETHGEPADLSETARLLLERRTVLAALASLPIVGAAEGACAQEPGNDFIGFEARPLESRIEELVAREEVLDLMARYAHRVAHGTSIAPLYTDDGAFIAHFPGQPVLEVRGRRALDGFFKQRDNGAAVTMVHNIVIDLKGDEGMCTCADKLFMPVNGKLWTGSGHYHDTLRRENGEWKFVTREITYFHWAQVAAVPYD